MKMPPLGIEPRYLWDERRMKLLYAAIERYKQEQYPAPREWYEEYNELRDKALAHEASTSTPRR